MELCERGTLRDQLGPGSTMSLAQPQPLVWRLVAQLGSALAHIHSHGMLHCDVTA